MLRHRRCYSRRVVVPLGRVAPREKAKSKRSPLAPLNPTGCSVGHWRLDFFLRTLYGWRSRRRGTNIHRNGKINACYFEPGVRDLCVGKRDSLVHFLDIKWYSGERYSAQFYRDLDEKKVVSYKRFCFSFDFFIIERRNGLFILFSRANIRSSNSWICNLEKLYFNSCFYWERDLKKGEMYGRSRTPKEELNL